MQRIASCTTPSARDFGTVLRDTLNTKFRFVGLVYVLEYYILEYL